MRIVELSDYSMVIMKDSENTFFFSIGDIYRSAKERCFSIAVVKLNEDDSKNMPTAVSKDYIYTGGKLILYFDQSIKGLFNLQDRVSIYFAFT